MHTGISENIVNDQAATPRTSSRDVGFTYDDAGRLTKEEGGDGLGVSYENAWQYDAAGNRAVTTYKRATKEAPNTVATTTTIAAVFSGNDWLKQQTSTVATAGTTNATTTFYGYDQNGAQTQEKTGAAGAVEVNDWQFDGTLASTVTQGQATGGSEFVYDAGGNRLKQRTQIGKPEAKEVRYLVDPNTSYAQVVQERDENNVLQARYAWEDGLAPLVMWRRAQNGQYAAFFYLCDGQDSVRQLTDASGRVTDSYFYDAFGNALQGGSGDTPNSFRYTGQQLDSSGDYYLRARYYNSGSGRFLSHDPLMGGSDDPITMHRYLYANADGINFVDPSGFAAAPPEFWIGQQVHRKIGSDFTAYNTIPTRLSDREFGPIFSRMGYPLPTGNLPYGGIPGFDLRPDLVDVATRKFFEIKMMNPDGIRKGTAEILEYQAIFTAHWMFTGCGELTTPGNAWDYMPPFLIPGIDMPGGAQYVAIVFPPVEGFIGYKLFNPRFPYYAAALALSLKYAQEIAVAGPGLAPALGQAYAVTVQSTTTAIQTAHTFIADAVAARTTQIRTMLALNGGFSPAIA